MPCLPKCFGGGKPPPPAEKKKKSEKKQEKADSDLKQRPLTDFFQETELRILGPLANRVKVVIDPSLPPTLHGTSRVTDGVPLAIVNPKAPDRRYVILHELMHHQLDELGCPSLCCTLQGKAPPDSWLRHTQFQALVRGLLVQLWELIQHSRFNLMLARVFKCGPESAREGEYRSYMNKGYLPAYGMCRRDGHPSLRRLAVAAHVATVELEGSAELQRDFRRFVNMTYQNGTELYQMGEKLVRCIDKKDMELLGLTRQQLDGEMQSMLDDLKKVIENLDSGMRIKVGPVQPLKEKFNGRCSTVSHVDFCDMAADPIVTVTAGGFGGRFGMGESLTVERSRRQGGWAGADMEEVEAMEAVLPGWRPGSSCGVERVMVSCRCREHGGTHLPHEERQHGVCRARARRSVEEEEEEAHATTTGEGEGEREGAGRSARPPAPREAWT